MIGRIRRLITALAAVAASTVATPLVPTFVLDARAHEIPADVRLNAFVRPAGNRLELLVRVPMAALVEVEFPLRGIYLDMARVDEALHSAVKLYLTDNITLYRQVICRVRQCACACAGAATWRRSRSGLESAIPRRAARISDPVGSL